MNGPKLLSEARQVRPVPKMSACKEQAFSMEVVSRQYPVGWLESPAAMPPENYRQVSALFGMTVHKN